MLRSGRIITWFIVFASLLGGGLADLYGAEPSRRLALVIGNSDYAYSPLKNPVNDANDMAEVLEGLGFEVIKRSNADRREMILVLDEFSRKLARADVGLFFFAGHGMQIGGSNYLIPVDTNISTAVDVEFEGIHAGRIIGKMAEAHTRLNVVILDACRNNPFRSLFRSQTRGLVRMDVPVGTIIAYATSPGDVAADGTGRNGMYTKHLIQALKDPQLNIQEVFNKAGLGVMQETDMAQVPWFNSSPMEPMFLAGGSPRDDLPVVRPEPQPSLPPVPDQPKPSGQPSTAEPVTAPQPVPAPKPQVAPAPEPPPKPTGGISVASIPSGATVTLAGRQVGTTPLDLDQLEPGTRIMEFSLDGYLPHSRKVSVVAGRVLAVEATLIPEPRPGRLTVDVSPAGATVRILNIKPPYRPGMELEAGSYHLEVSREGYQTTRQWVELEKGAELVVPIVLAKAEAKPVTTEPTTSTAAAKTAPAPSGQPARLVSGAGGVLLDRANGLMWASRDNGYDVDWQRALQYCRTYKGEGHADWRLPTQAELKRLYRQGVRFAGGGGPSINLTSKRLWSSNGSSKKADMLNFADGGELQMFKNYSRDFRVLPVRDLPKSAAASDQERDSEVAAAGSQPVETKPVGTKPVAAKPRTGSLTVKPTPEGADVRILNIKPPYRPGIELEAGSYQLEVSKEGFETVQKWVELESGTELVVPVALGKRSTKPEPEQPAPPSPAGKPVSTRQLVAGKDGLVLDRDNGLMWAPRDNGYDIDWQKAMEYCSSYQAGGYRDWRLPTLAELKMLYQQGLRYGSSEGVTVELSRKRLWSADGAAKKAALLNLTDGGELQMFKEYSRRFRVLPVRNLN